MALCFGDDFRVHKSRGTQTVKGTTSPGGGGEPNPEATLWVNASTGDDSRSKATVAASGGSLPWATIGRAVWGSTNRSSPNASEAAAAGDIVSIAGSASLVSPQLYTTSVSVRDLNSPVYTTVNEGTLGNPITFVADGYVRLGAPNANSPIIGGNTDYIKWYADRTNSRFLITCDGRFGTPVNISSSVADGTVVLTVNTATNHGYSTGDRIVLYDHNCTPAIEGAGSAAIVNTITVVDANTFTMDTLTNRTASGGATGTARAFYDEKADTSVVNTTPDHGPILVSGTGCEIEGFDIDGGEVLDYTDNWDGVRCASAINAVVRNNDITGFHNFTSSVNSAGIKLYDSDSTLVENNTITDCGSGLGVKNAPTGSAVDIQNNIIRRNRIDDVSYGIFYSISGEPGGDRIYQNLITNIGQIGLYITGGDVDNLWFFNNTLVSMVVGVYISSASHTSSKVYGNIFYGVTDRAIEVQGLTWSGIGSIDLEHNVYVFNGGQFYRGSDGTRDKSSFDTAFNGNHDDSPAAVVSTEPPDVFADIGNDDYTLGGSSPALNRAVDIGDLDGDSSTVDIVDAGAYAGNPTIGVEGGIEPTLWVNASTGSDSNTRAQVRAGGGTVQWQTIGRAAWGSTNRSAPDSTEAAEAGDIVSIAAGTYGFSGVIDDRFGVVYNPENEGTADNPIRFVADGVVVLTATDAEAPVIGSNSQDYIEWYADISQGHFWQISACPEDPGGSELCTGAVVACTPDTGPVVFLGVTGGLIEGAQITASRDSNLGLENWPAIRLENSTGVRVRNNEIADFRVEGNVYNGHACAVQLYTCQDCIIEHNYGHNIGAGVALKDNDGSGQFSSGNIIRYNLFETVGEAFSVSHVGETLQDEGSDFYQNVVNTYLNAIGGSGHNSERFYNNTFYNGTLDTNAFAFQIRAAANPGTVDDGFYNVKIWNNIIHTADYAIYTNSTAMPATTAVHMERNCYYSFGVHFYTSDVDGNRTFASYQGAYPTQDVNSVNSDPLFTNAAAGDFTLQGGSPAIDLGRHPDNNATINAGAYITGNEVIGLES